MAEIARWSDFRFEVSPALIRSFSEMTIKGSSETEEKTDEGTKYVSRKNAKPAELSLTVELSAFTGCAVESEALRFVTAAEEGETGYFYMGGKKLLPCPLMLTEAKISEAALSSAGKWVQAKVQLSFKQCAKGKDDGKVSVRNPPPTGIKKPGPTALTTSGSGLNKGGVSLGTRTMMTR